ncbi:TetR/AcrR family transcriptional regulator [Glaciimonas sp. GNP009]
MATQSGRTTSSAIQEGLPQTRADQILDIARRLFGEHGYDRTSLRDIAEAAGITKAALYYHFPDKDALFKKVVIEGLQHLIADVGAAIEKESTALSRIKAFFYASMDFYEAHPSHFMAGSNSFRVQTGDKRLMALELRDKYEGILRECLREAMENKDLRRVDEALLARYLLSSFNQINRWYSPEGKMTLREVTDSYLDFAFNGILVGVDI